MTTPYRRHDIDALRALAFLLLIVYHVGMYYVADWPWHLKSAHAATWLQWPMVAINVWRMDLVFLLSGVAFAMLARQAAPLQLLRRRAIRLLVPLVFGMWFVVVWQAYAEAVDKGAVAPGIVDFVLRYWQMGPWPEDAFAGADFGVTWNHLWYLPYLFVYTALMCLLLPLWRLAAGQRLRAAFCSLRGPAMLLLPALPLALYGVLLAERFPATHDLLHDGHLHPLYFTVFAYGFVLGTDAGAWNELMRLRRWALGLALASLAIYLVTRAAASAGWAPWRQVLRAGYAWFALVAILGFGHRWLNRPWRWLPWASESVYPWYMLHQTLIVVLAYGLAPMRLSAGAEATLLLGGTLLGCWLLTDFAIRRTRWLRPLFGLNLRRPIVRTPEPARPAVPKIGPSAR
ncbi:acyltransferase family protein [Variovorax dokdonensis]|uniref:Acyltransferase family protein n=1 Tax=Variovorax dokdonensis TaxID=344883 RepID=A0ABT7N7S6_9BURK|nr:acyltransferase family protein [Variovorax dokdonensis]MDM0043971.1 acyltransferase family protein [Variovorax dokdonensis]